MFHKKVFYFELCTYVQQLETGTDTIQFTFFYIKNVIFLRNITTQQYIIS